MTSHPSLLKRVFTFINFNVEKLVDGVKRTANNYVEE